MERFGYLISIILLFFLLFQEKCSKESDYYKTTTKEHFSSDTVFSNLLEKFSSFIPESKTIIVSSKDEGWKERIINENKELKDHVYFIEEYLKEKNDSLEKKLSYYDDSLSDENLTIYTTNVVDGNMISSGLKYKLKVPKIITNTITKEIKTEKYRGQLILNAGSGFNKEGVSNLSIGIDHVSKKGLLKGFYYNAIDNSYNVRIGKRIF